MVELKNVSVVYGEQHALRRVNLSVEQGEFVFLVGATGAGKSTLFKLLYGAIRPTEGEVWVLGQPVHRLKPRELPYLRRRIGVVPQDYPLLPHKTVWENIAYGLRAIGYNERAVRQRVAQMLALVGLNEQARQFPHQLSGGEAQRAAIARALANNPPLLIADEPTANLDPDTSWEIVGLLTHINLRGTTVIVSTHNRMIVDRACQRVVAMDRGQIISDVPRGGYPVELDRLHATVML
ncbi:MAG: ATP-binding cassette domain-containing protein [Fimbriimonadales bacterium]|nr:ATP-binding cassette domain-containing protein [Fimbriimonadales bacterium]